MRACGAGLLRQLPAPHTMTSDLLSAARELSQAFPDASGYRTPEPQARLRCPRLRCACLGTGVAREALILRRLLRLPEAVSLLAQPVHRMFSVAAAPALWTSVWACRNVQSKMLTRIVPAHRCTA